MIYYIRKTRSLTSIKLHQTSGPISLYRSDVPFHVLCNIVNINNLESPYPKRISPSKISMHLAKIVKWK